MHEADVRKYQEAAAIIDGYIEKYIRKSPYQSLWEDHAGQNYHGDLGYFLDTWDDIMDALKLKGGD